MKLVLVTRISAEYGARAISTVSVKMGQVLAEIPNVWRTRHSYRIREDGTGAGRAPRCAAQAPHLPYP